MKIVLLVLMLSPLAGIAQTAASGATGNAPLKIYFSSATLSHDHMVLTRNGAGELTLNGIGTIEISGPVDVELNDKRTEARPEQSDWIAVAEDVAISGGANTSLKADVLSYNSA